jgi:hypothetical protein
MQAIADGSSETWSEELLVSFHPYHYWAADNLDRTCNMYTQHATYQAIGVNR